MDVVVKPPSPGDESYELFMVRVYLYRKTYLLFNLGRKTERFGCSESQGEACRWYLQCHWWRQLSNCSGLVRNFHHKPLLVPSTVVCRFLHEIIGQQRYTALKHFWPSKGCNVRFPENWTTSEIYCRGWVKGRRSRCLLLLSTSWGNWYLCSSWLGIPPKGNSIHTKLQWHKPKLHDQNLDPFFRREPFTSGLQFYPRRKQWKNLRLYSQPSISRSWKNMPRC